MAIPTITANTATIASRMNMSDLAPEGCCSIRLSFPSGDPAHAEGVHGPRAPLPSGLTQLEIGSRSRLTLFSSVGAMLAERRLETTTAATTMPAATTVTPIRSATLSA